MGFPAQLKFICWRGCCISTHFFPASLSSYLQERVTIFIFHYSLNEAKSGQPCCKRIHLAFLNSIPETYQLANKNMMCSHTEWPLNHCKWVPYESGKFKKKGGAEIVSGQLLTPETFQLQCVVPSSAITLVAQSFLSQHFYCICCPRQTAIIPR